MEEAIKLAVEGGYAKEYYSGKTPEEIDKMSNSEIGSVIREDPLFWKALGKGLGWATVGKGLEVICENGHTISSIVAEEYRDIFCYRCGTPYTIKEREFEEREWFYKWISFIEHLAEGKDADSFFTELLTHKDTA